MLILFIFLTSFFKDNITCTLDKHSDRQNRDAPVTCPKEPIVRRLFSGNSSSSSYTSGDIACQVSRAHTRVQDCSPWVVSSSGRGPIPRQSEKAKSTWSTSQLSDPAGRPEIRGPGLSAGIGSVAIGTVGAAPVAARFSGRTPLMNSLVPVRSQRTPERQSLSGSHGPRPWVYLALTGRFQDERSAAMMPCSMA